MTDDPQPHALTEFGVRVPTPVAEEIKRIVAKADDSALFPEAAAKALFEAGYRSNLGRRAWLALIDGAERLLCVCGTNGHPHPYCYPGGPLEFLCSGCLTPWRAPALPRAEVGPDPIALVPAYEAD